MFSPTDIEQLHQKGITPSMAQKQLNRFQSGFLFAKIQSDEMAQPDGPSHRLLQLDNESIAIYRQEWLTYLHSSARIVKFVPASGAASRMFKDLFGYDEGVEEMSPSVVQFFDQITHFAFYRALDVMCEELYGKHIDYLVKHKRYADVLKALLSSEGLNYGYLPKALLQFHTYEDHARTPLEEHLVEGALYAKNKDLKANLHFTVSPEHMVYVKDLVERCVEAYEEKFDIKYDISYSVQKSSTDTLAADASGDPYRENGRLVFRPGGHGALIENLNDLHADIIFIKNIDNVVPDLLKAPTVLYKEALAGVLVHYQKAIFAIQEELQAEKITRARLDEIEGYLRDTLDVRLADAHLLSDEDMLAYLRSKFNRPLRVCGVVKNTGEPGGGPFYLPSADGSMQGQIVESAQVDLSDPHSKAVFEQSTHFNPVDLVCGVRDVHGTKYDLPKFVDPEAGFIAQKSKDGVTIQALELPGLWNGAMADWNTIFVEVPIETFNPVKTVNDLLREQHQ